MHTIEDVYNVLDTATFACKTESDMKRSNANVDGDTSMGAMLTYGSEVARMWVDDKLLPPVVKDCIDANLVYIHDKDFYGLTETCCQIRLDELFKDGFHTGHGYVREPNSITTAAALTCIAIQSNQNEMHGGQAIPAFDWYLAPYVERSYNKHYHDVLKVASELKESVEPDCEKWRELAWERTVEETYQAMEALIHNLNTMHSRAGAQVPFSSINYGTCTTREGRLIIESVLKATEKGLGHGETPIFPVQIFKVKEGVNYNEGDPNYDLFQLAMQVSAKRLFPNFSFLDSPFNAQYLKGDDPNYEVAYMGCRTRVMSNVDKEHEQTGGRGNLSFTSVNLPGIALSCDGDTDVFIERLGTVMDVVKLQLEHRLAIQKSRRVYNYPFLMGNGVWLGSDELEWNDEVGDILNHGTLTIGFIGLAEAMVALFGKHHGESDDVWDFAYDTIRFMRERCDAYTESSGLNFSLIATPAEGLSGKFVPKDRERYGEIEGITDKSYYTNSFHIPVYYDITIADKIEREAPFHELCNGGHITYIELDGDVSANPQAFEAVIRYMHDHNVGYGAINHPVDRDPVCGYTGVIGDTCPCCGRREFEAVE